MNDVELDEMLDRWEAPAMRESLREDLRAGFAVVAARAKRRGLLRRMIDAAPRIRVGRLAVATVGAGALLFAALQVAPRVVRMASPDGFRIPFYVEFDFYSDNPSGPYRSRQTTFPWGGIDLIMAVAESRGSVLDPVRKIAASIRTQFVLARPSIVLPKHPPMTEPAWFAGFVRSGCSERRNVVGQETIAGYETTVTESATPRGRMKFWLAPDLACYCLKMTEEIVQPDGSYRLTLNKEAVRVMMNR